MSSGLGHNGGPPLEHEPPWAGGDPYVYLCWKRACHAAWRGVSKDIMRFRLKKAERLDLTYREYTLEILEHGRHLQPEDAEHIAEIKRARRRG